MSSWQFDRWMRDWVAMAARGETLFDQRLTWKIRTFALAIITVALLFFSFGYLAAGGAP